ncbi:MAG: LysM peptidoglycan-binding domain-containing protein, partial [Nitrososphaerales archaeon]
MSLAGLSMVFLPTLRSSPQLRFQAVDTISALPLRSRPDSPPDPRPVSLDDAWQPLEVSTAAATSEAATVSYVVEPGDTLWSIAERELGSPLRWREIAALNLGRVQPDGRELTDAHWIFPGWVLLLPTSPDPPEGSVPGTAASTNVAPTDEPSQALSVATRPLENSTSPPPEIARTREA